MARLTAAKAAKAPKTAKAPAKTTAKKTAKTPPKPTKEAVEAPPAKRQRKEPAANAASAAPIAPSKAAPRDVGNKFWKAAYRSDVASCKRWLEAGAPVDTFGDSSGGPHECTALGAAAMNGGKDSTEVVALLLDNGASIDLANTEGGTPLLCAARNGRPETVALLLAKGANIDKADKNGKTPLLHAAACTYAPVYSDIVAMLLEKGASVNVRNVSGETALFWAAKCGRVASVRALLAAGADVHIADNKGKKPIDETESEEIRGLLLAAAARR